MTWTSGDEFEMVTMAIAVLRSLQLVDETIDIHRLCQGTSSKGATKKWNAMDIVTICYYGHLCRKISQHARVLICWTLQKDCMVQCS